LRFRASERKALAKRYIWLKSPAGGLAKVSVSQLIRKKIAPE
jgi:hypothetical protein